ncbi:hypothetical protein BKA82DRAFT_29133 [Pisolithus tinctorius]|nr:hypothetical protein BKA82DRAFT_29133 [Pisolithus tinctorius]
MDFDHVAPLRNDVIRLAHTLQVSRPGGSSALLTVQLELLFGTTGELDGQLGSHHDISPRDILLLTTLLSSSCSLPGATGTDGLGKLELVRAGEIYTCLMSQVAAGQRIGMTVQHLGKGKDMMDMDEEDDSGVRTLRELCFHHLTVFRAFLYLTVKIAHVVRCAYKRDVKSCFVSPTYCPARSESPGGNSSGLHTEQSYCCSAVLRCVVAGIMEQSGTSGALASSERVEARSYAYRLRGGCGLTVYLLKFRTIRVMRSPLRICSLPVGASVFSQYFGLGIPRDNPSTLKISHTNAVARDALDAQVARAAGELSVDSLVHLFNVIGEGIEDPGLPVDQCKSLIHFSTILHLKPAAVRSVDLGSIWSLLCKILSGTTDHDNASSFAMFHCIVSIAGSLVRLRRDIVIHTLPHLAFVLHRPLLITRRMRSQPGAEQRHVLLAYIDSMNDPLCILTPEIRRELEPGLFSLCEMLGEHNREALMVSALDSGGMTLMKSFWREYEKQ